MQLFKATLGCSLAFLLAIGFSGCFSPDVPDLPNTDSVGSANAEQLVKKEVEIAELQSELAEKEAELQRLKSDKDRSNSTPPARRLRPGGAPGICDRSPEVQNAIIYALQIPSCKLIDADELFRVREIGSLGRLRSVQAHDFAELPNLLELSVSICGPGPLPNGLFDDLVNLERLYLTVKDRRYVPLDTLERLEALPSMETLDIYESC